MLPELASFISDKTKFGDLHVHTKFSNDSDEEIEEYVKKAIELGYGFVGFSDHMDVDQNDPDGSFLNYAGYRVDFERVKKKYENDIKMFFGVEIDYQSIFLEEIQNFCKQYSFDFIIGSVHCIFGKQLYRLMNGKEPLTKCYEEYVKENIKMMRSIPLDIVGHMDFPRRYTRGEEDICAADIFSEHSSQLLKSVLETWVLLEINTSNLLKGLSSFMPCKEFIQKYYDATKRTVLASSDSHSVKDFVKTNDIRYELWATYGRPLG